MIIGKCNCSGQAVDTCATFQFARLKGPPWIGNAIKNFPHLNNHSHPGFSFFEWILQIKACSTVLLIIIEASSPYTTAKSAAK